MDRSRTKLVCTIGPASAERIGELVAAGMDVARINFSHGTPEDHRGYVHAVRAAAHSARRSVAVMVDLPGPKIRLGELEGGEIRLETGTTFTLRPDKAVQSTGAEEAPPASDEIDDTAGSAMTVSEIPRAPEATGASASAPVSTPGWAALLEAGDRILLADGAAELRVTGISAGTVETHVVHGGTVRSRSGVNVPSNRLTGDGLTDDDRAAIPRALELRADIIAQSFVRGAEDVQALRSMLPADGPRIVAKVETRAAVDNFDKIAQAADGIMVARGDLGVDLPFEEVPLVQKDLIRRATRAGRFSIVATQMLESMTSAPRPTRAEASDVANAVLDGTDAVMLSAETAIGQFPIEALQAMGSICAKTEADGGGLMVSTDPPADDAPPAEIIAAATYVASSSPAGRSSAIWCFTRSGRTAELLSLQRPGIPIIAFTLSPVIARRLAVRSAVVPMVLPTTGARDQSLIGRMESAWRAQKNRASFDAVILVTTSRQPAGINRLEMHTLGDQGTDSK